MDVLSDVAAGGEGDYYDSVGDIVLQCRVSDGDGIGSFVCSVFQGRVSAAEAPLPSERLDV